MSTLENTRDELIEEESTAIEDEAERDEIVPSVSYQITAYGADYDVEGLVRRLEKGDIFVPSFQRSYVWTLPQASQFVESLLLGLPVPGVFLARDEATSKLQILDGQQRLKTLLFFRQGVFNPSDDHKFRRVFALTNVQHPFDSKTYETLSDKDRRRLDDSIIHATVVRQDSPQDDDTSIYHIFKRLNSGGTLLTAQEIRCAVYHGPLIDELKALNEHDSWRRLFEKKNRRLKDQELILRFFALYFRTDKYERPMSEFLNRFARVNRNAPRSFLDQCAKLFGSTVRSAEEALGDKAFRPERALNAAVFDSVMVGLARRLAKERSVDSKRVSAAYEKLLQDDEYIRATSSGTAYEGSVSVRLSKATAFFADI